MQSLVGVTIVWMNAELMEPKSQSFGISELQNQHICRVYIMCESQCQDLFLYREMLG